MAEPTPRLKLGPTNKIMCNFDAKREDIIGTQPAPSSTRVLSIAGTGANGLFFI